MDYFKESLKLHAEHKGKMEIKSKFPLRNFEDLSVAYTPGVAEPCRKIADDVNDAYKYTTKANTVAVVTDGSAVLGLGNIGATAALPVMEGKCLLFKKFAGVDAVPICIETQDPDEIIDIVKNISPAYGGINLEDIKAPQCFYIEKKLKEILKIPVFHDDQHGTAIVCLAGLINAFKLTGRDFKTSKIVIAGAGAAGIAIAKILIIRGVKNIILLDSKGVIGRSRKDLQFMKKEMAEITNPGNIVGGLKEAMVSADVFIGVSKPKIVSSAMVKSMNDDAIVFALSNPVPEIDPEMAKKAGAAIVATGRSDYPNQINNVLAFPGIFKGALKLRNKQITDKMKVNAAVALAESVKNPSAAKIIPGVFDKGVAEIVARVVVRS
ncbi:NADP-dependent malic enzyme [Patescibacteria group bacterium]|nr:NADP-dependent malic enzyme [Patescibacteria group bacterium]